ncbi:hypothetical protein Tco_1449970 [Tanacetum coccineum]
MHAATSPTVESPGHILESDPEEDPEEDPADYPTDRDDDEEEEEEEHPAPVDFVPPVHQYDAMYLSDEPSISLPPRKSCLPLRKRVCFASPTPSHEVGERAIDEFATTTVVGVNLRVTDMATIVEGECIVFRVTISRSRRLRGDFRVIDIRPQETGVTVAHGSTWMQPGMSMIAILQERGPLKELIGLTQWFEKMEYVYSISNCTVACQVKGNDVVALCKTFQDWLLMLTTNESLDDTTGNNRICNQSRDKTWRAYAAGNGNFKKVQIRTTMSSGSRIVITPTALDHVFNVELDDGRIVGLNYYYREFATPVARATIRFAPSNEELAVQKGWELNNCTVKSRYPFLRIDELFDRGCTGSVFYSKIRSEGQGSSTCGEVSRRSLSHRLRIRTRTVTIGIPSHANVVADASEQEGNVNHLRVPGLAAQFEALYGQKCLSPMCWAELDKFQTHWLTDIALQAEIELLKSEQGPLYVSCFQLEICSSDDPLVVPLEGLQVDDKLYFVEEPIEIMDREVKQLRRSRVPIVKSNPQQDLLEKGVIDGRCSRHMTGNMSYLTDFKEIDGGYVIFRGNPKGGKSQAENSVLFNDTDCIVLAPNFKLTDESHVLLKVPRKNNMYSVDLKNIVPNGALVDGKKIIVTKASVRSDLQLDDKEGMDCLPNTTIFEELTRMGSKTTAWNEFSSTMASAIICLAKNQKFNFSKYIFESMVKNLDNVSGNFLMYPRSRRSGEGSEMPTDPHHTPTIIQPSTSQPQKKQKPRKPKRKDTGIPQSSGPTNNVADEAVYEEMDDSLEKAVTTVTSLDAEQDRGNINKTQSKATPNEPSFPGTSSGGGPRCQETMRDTIAQTRSENVSKLSNGPLLTETSQAQEITSLKRRVKRLEKKGGSRTHRLKILYKVGLSRRVESSNEEGLGKEDASKQGRIADIDADTGINLVSTHFDADTDMFGVHDLVGDEVVVESEVVVKASKIIPVSAATTTTTVITDDEITLAKALAELKSAKLPTTIAATTITAVSTRPRAKGIIIHEQEQKLSKKDQLMLDEELAFKLQAEEEEKERLAREKAQQIEEVNIAWDDVQARVEADYQLAQRLQAQEQEELTDEEKARLFVQFLEQRRKHFASKRAEEKRNIPPTRAQQRSFMCTYLKNMEGWKPKDLKNKSFANIQELFNKAMKRVNTFVDYRTELVEESSKKAKVEIAQESSSKRSGTELEQESIKKQKVDEDKEIVELQRLIEIVPDEEEVAIDAITLATKPPSIVDYKIPKEGKKTYYQIIRADGSSKMYLVFSHMLKSFDRDPVEIGKS